MPDIAPLLVAVLSALAIPFIVVGLIGRSDSSRPRCRRCGADAPEFQWDAPSACQCGAVLSQPGALRVQRRWRWLPMLIGVVLAALATGLGYEAAHVYADALGWRAAMPTWLFVRTRDHDANPFIYPDRNQRRLDSNLSRADAQRWLATLLEDESTEDQPNYLVNWLAHIAPPEGELGRRFMERTMKSTELLIRRGNSGVELHLQASPGNSMPPLFVRIDSVTVDGKEIEVRRVSRDDESIERHWFNTVFPPRVVLGANDNATIVVRGSAAYCGPIEGCINNDPLITTNDDPTQWKLPVAMASFEMTSATSSRVTASALQFPLVWSPSPRYTAFFAPVNQIAQPLATAGSNVIGSACAGALAGAAFAIGLVAARLTLRRRLALVAPSCTACGATVRSAAEASPGRCSECGRSLGKPGAIRKTAAINRIPRAGLVSCIVALTGFAVAAWYAPRVASHVSALWESRSRTDQACGAWAADRFLTNAPLEFDDWWDRFGVKWIAPPGGRSREIALRRIAERWREFEPAMKRAHPQDEQRMLGRWAGAIVSVITEFGADEYRKTLDDIVAECRVPNLSMPRCVRVGEPIKVVRSYSELPAKVLVRLPSRAGVDSTWQAPERFKLPVPTEPGVIDCDVEWMLAWNEPSAPKRPLSEAFKRSQASGTLHQRVLVLPRDPLTTDDSRANPLAAPSLVVMGIEEIGERDWVWINVLPENGGAQLHGRFELDFGAGESNTVNMFSMSALVATPSVLPEVITMTFVPTPKSTSSGPRPPILWNATQTMKLRHVGYSPLHRAEIYESGE